MKPRRGAARNDGDDTGGYSHGLRKCDSRHCKAPNGDAGRSIRDLCDFICWHSGLLHESIPRKISKLYQGKPPLSKIYPVKGMAKPRMTRSDKWKVRPIVAAYRAYKDELRIMGVELDMDRFYHVIFVMPMPKSWSEKKRDEMRYTRHQQVPDKDNLEKGLLDALFSDDAAAWDGRVTKVWADKPAIVTSTDNMDVCPESIQQLIQRSK